MLHAVPAQLKVAISVGIGLFIALIGFVDAGFVRRIPDAAGTTVPVQLGATGQLSGWPVLVFGVGLILLVALWVRRRARRDPRGDPGHHRARRRRRGDRPPRQRCRRPGGWSLDRARRCPTTSSARPTSRTLGEFSLLGSFEQVGVVAAVLLVFTLLLADFFDTMGTMTAIGAEAGPARRGRHAAAHPADPGRRLAGRRRRRPGGTSVQHQLHRVGLRRRRGSAHRPGLGGHRRAVPADRSSSRPLVAVIPSEAAVPALVLVGFLMMQQVTGIDWHDAEVAIPAFLTIVLMPFTYSITVASAPASSPTS